MLIEHGANTWDRGGLRTNPLEAAIAYRHRDVLRALLEAGGVPQHIAQGSIPLQVAAKSPNLEALRMLLDAGFPVDARDRENRTPLMCAAAELGSSRERLEEAREVFQLLLARGADVNAQDARNDTPLLLLSAKGDCVEEARLLLEHGADPHAGAGQFLGESPLQRSRQADCPNMVALIEQHILAHSSLHAAAANDAEAVRLFLMNPGGDVNARDGDDEGTPLHRAAASGACRAANVLLSRANVNARDAAQRTPLAVAKAEGHQDMVSLLRKHGGKVGRWW